MRQVQEEGLIFGALDELDRFGGIEAGQIAQDVQNVVLELGLVAVERAGSHAAGVRHAVIAVKTKAQRMKFGLLAKVAQMPFANHGRTVARHLQAGCDAQLFVR